MRNRSGGITLLVLSAISFFALTAAAQSHETGFLNRSVTVGGVEYRYQVYVPREFRSDIAWPVIVALHGGGTYADDGISQTEGGVGKQIRLHPNRFPALVVFPQAHADNTPAWQRQGGEAALAELDKTIAEFHGDRSRVYLTGFSAGGNGAWFLASHHPERFAAVIVISGFVTDFRGKQSGLDYPSLAPPGVADAYAYVAGKVAGIPIRIFHGDADKNVSVEESRNMYKALKAAKADVEYTEYPGVPHDAWTQSYDKAELWEWLLRQRKR